MEMCSPLPLIYERNPVMLDGRLSIPSASGEAHLAIFNRLTGAGGDLINSDHFSGNISSILVSNVKMELRIAPNLISAAAGK
jgi:hypothetical protein